MAFTALAAKPAARRTEATYPTVDRGSRGIASLGWGHRRKPRGHVGAPGNRDEG